MKEKRSAEDAQLAEWKVVALQHSSHAKSSQANSLFYKVVREKGKENGKTTRGTKKE